METSALALPAMYPHLTKLGTNPTGHISGAIHYPESSLAVIATQKETLPFSSVTAWVRAASYQKSSRAGAGSGAEVL